MLGTDGSTASRNMGDCRNVTWDQMLDRFISCYSGYYTEADLVRIHRRWKQLSAEAGWSKVK